MKKHAATIVLVVLALGLGLWLWLDRDRITEGERKGRENSAFVVWRRDELTKVSIAHDGETLVLERDRPATGPSAKGEGKEGQWRMTSPRKERADAVAVERLLTTLEFATVARKVGAGVPLGLDAPRAVGHMWMGSLDVPFVLGGTSPTPEGSGYLRVGDGAPIVVSKEVTEALLAPSDRYRDRTVVPYLATELSRFEAKHEAGAFTLERIDDQSFRVTEAGVLASRAAVERLWAALSEIRAEAFPNDADIDRLTAHPAVTLKLTPKDTTKPPAELVLGEACPGHPADVVVLRRTPTRAAACAPKDVIATFLASVPSLVEKHLLPLRMDEIEEVRLEHDGSQPLDLARKGTGFHLRSPEDRDLTAGEADAATELITRIARSEATTVTRGGGPFASVGRVVARFGGEHEQIVELSAPLEGGHAMLRRLLDDARLEVDASVYRRLVPRGTSLRPRTMLEGEKRRPTRVLLRCGKDQDLLDSGEGFRLVAPAAYETDGAVVQLVEGLMKGQIDTWVADADDGSFGFTKDGCHVVLAFADGNAPVTVWFGAEAEGGIYARVDPRHGVLVAPRALRDLAKRIYVSRGLLRTDAARIESVRVTSAGKVVAGDPDRLRDAVAGLIAQRVESFDKPSGPPGLVIEVAVSEGGPRRRITCRSSSPTERRCGLDGVSATLAVSEATLAPLLGQPDGGKAP